MKYAIYPFKRKNKFRLYIRFEDESGNRRHLSTGVTYPLDASKKQQRDAHEVAEEKATSILIDHLQKKQKVEEEQNKAPLLSEYLDAHYYPHVRSSCTSSTLTSYQGALNHFIRILGDHPIDHYERKMMNTYKVTRFDSEDIRKTTINIEMRSIKTAFSWAYKNEYLQKNPYRGQAFMFKAKSKKRAFKRYEIKKLLKITEGKMIGLAIRLAYFTGMRIGELSKIKWAMVNLDGPHINLASQMTKTKNARSIPLSKRALNIVKILEHVLKNKIKNNPEVYENKVKQESYLLQKQRGHGQYAPRSIQQKFRRCMNEAGLPKELTFHCLRHSFATHVLENENSDLLGVSKVLGHTTPAVTEEFYDHTEALNYRHIPEML